MKFQATAIAMTAALSLGAVQTTDAAILSIDFNNATSPTESGFTGQSSTSATYFGATPDEITVAINGAQGNFDRGASSGVNNNLYRDFFFDNFSTGFTLTLSGAGIDALTDYVLTFYSYDSEANQNRDTSFTPINGTAGPTLGPVSRTNNSDVPDTLDEFAVTGTFTSAGDGTLTIKIDDTPTTGARSVLNGLVLEAVPEPGSLALLGLGGLLIARRRRG